MSNTNDFLIRDGVLKAYNGKGGDVVIPYGVKKIERALFKGCKKLQSVVIPEGVTEIDFDTFLGCKSLKSVKLPNSLKSIKSAAFRDCAKLENINIPNSVRSIETYVFYGCGRLKSISIPYGVQTLQAKTFLGCKKLECITITEGVTYINPKHQPRGFGTFEKCKKTLKILAPKGSYAESFAFSEHMQLETYANDAVYDGEWKDGKKHGHGVCTYANGDRYDGEWSNNKKHGRGVYTFANGDKYEGKWLGDIMDQNAVFTYTDPNGFVIENDVLIGYTGKGGDIAIPEGITSIDNNALDGENIKSVTVHDNVTTLDKFAFGLRLEDELVIRGKKGSYIESFAKANELPFEAID